MFHVKQWAAIGEQRVFHVKRAPSRVSARRVYFPIQKSRKITSSTSSTSIRPVRRPRARGRQAKLLSDDFLPSGVSGPRRRFNASKRVLKRSPVTGRVMSTDSPASELHGGFVAHARQSAPRRPPQ